MRRTLAENGFNESSITQTLTPNIKEEQLVDVAFRVVSGPQARVGAVQVTGDSGMSADAVQAPHSLENGANVDHDTGNRALSRGTEALPGATSIWRPRSSSNRRSTAGDEEDEFRIFSESRAAGEGSGGRREHGRGEGEAADSGV
jgi:hypothetical protein